MTLNAAALSDYTQGRLAADDATTRILNAALGAVRRWCGWHVTPVTSQTLTLDGPGGLYLHLPTLALTALTSVSENGAALDVTKLAISPRGVVSKVIYQQPPAPVSQFLVSAPRPWNYWTDSLGGLVVTFSHGYASADDFETAVLSVADRMSLASAGGQLTSVGPFRWATDSAQPGELLNSAELAILEQYRLERPA